MRRCFALILLLLAAPVIAQEDAATYFALTSNQTFAPGDKAAIQMWAQGLKTLDFRLYRVDKAADFLGQLADAHSFGNRVADLPKESTPLARFARWKHQMRLKAVLFVRGQFTQDARESYRAMMEPEAPAQPKTQAKGTGYAEIPILNPNQLVKTWKETVSTKQRWDEQRVDIPVSDAGLYLVEATNGKLRAYTLVSVSGIAVMTKTQPGQSIARVVDRVSGQALSGVEVEFRSSKQSHGAVKTDANGFAKIAAADSSDVFVIATRGNDIAFDALNDYVFQPREERSINGYIYTDRPVYRPGHKVFFKAVLRSPAAFGYTIPKLTEVNAEITDNDGKTIYRKDLQMSAFGTVHGEFELPVTAGLGYYALKFKSGAAESYGGFNVEEYKKPEYEVKIKAAKARVVQGERVDAVVQAKYFFGEPVKNAKVTYTVRRGPYYPPWYEADDSGFEQTEGDESGGDYFSGEQGEEIEGKLNDKGELTIQLPTPVTERDYLFRIEAKVMDEGNREVIGYGLVIATRGTYMVVANTDRYVVEPGANAGYTVTLKDYDLKPIQGNFRAELQRYRYESGKRVGDRVIDSASGRTGPDGTGKFSFRLPDAGSYTVKVTSRTPEGRDVNDSAWIWVSGAGALFGGDEEKLTLVTDKKKYSPGDVARVLILTTEPDADLWVTTESRTVIDSKAVKAAKAGGVTVEIPIKSEYSPKVFVSASYLKAGKLHTGQATLRIPAVERELSIQLTPSRQEYKPGEPAQFLVEVKDNKGQPARAELSLGVVDEALYAVQKDLLQTPMSHFYGNVYNEVNSSNSLSYYFRGEAGKRAMRLAQIRPSLGQVKPDRVGDPRVRKAFPDTAFWLADLVTDGSGKGKVEFNFPDALTMWRTTARGFTTDTKVGMALNRVIVRKNLLLRMVSPRFFMEGDEVTVGVIVQNYLSSAKDTKVSLNATGLDLLDGGEKTVNVEAKGSKKVEFRVRVKAGTETVLTAKGITNEESDAMELTIPVKPYGTLLSNGGSGALVSGQTGKATLKAPGGSRTIEVRVSPSMAGSLFGALEYLTQFPYGCTEQTMSSFLPNVIVSKALDELKIKSNVRRDDLLKKVTAGMERLYDYQHDDGAWGWWKNDESHPFMTAHVISGLKQAKAAGYPANDDVIKRGEKWLRTEFRRQNDALSDLRAYMAYALGGKDDVETAWSARPKMTSYGLAFLGLALDALKDPRALEIAQALESAAQQNDAEAWWPGLRDPLLDFPNDITPETTSYVLKLLSRQRPNSPLLPKAAVWLTMHKDQGQWWNSTKQTAMVIYGVTDYLKASGELKPEISVTVSVNGKQVLAKDFGEADATAINPAMVTLPAGDSNDIEVKVNGKGRVYWNAQAKYFTTAEERTPSEGGAMSVQREYFRLVPRENAGTTTYALETLSGDIRPGDTIAVLLNVTAKDWKYVLVEDPIPAGMELVTNDNTFNLAGKPQWWRYSWAQKEYRDDKVAFFRTYFYKDTSQFFYVMKAVNPGKFRVPPTRIQPMYQPQQVGTGKAATIEVLQ